MLNTPLYHLLSQAFADLVIKVLDENDNPPLFQERSYEAEIAENSIAGTTVLPVSNTLRRNLPISKSSFFTSKSSLDRICCLQLFKSFLLELAHLYENHSARIFKRTNLTS